MIDLFIYLAFEDNFVEAALALRERDDPSSYSSFVSSIFILFDLPPEEKRKQKRKGKEKDDKESRKIKKLFSQSKAKGKRVEKGGEGGEKKGGRGRKKGGMGGEEAIFECFGGALEIYFQEVPRVTQLFRGDCVLTHLLHAYIKKEVFLVLLLLLC